MKKLLFVLCLMGAVVFAQAQLKFGAKVGLNIAKVTGDDMDDAKSLLAPQFGVFANYSISDKLGIQPELLYSMQGFKMEESYEGETYEGKLKLDYILVPIMVKFYPITGLSLQAGPQFGFLVSAKWKETGEDEIDVKDDAKKFDLGLNLGAGYELENGLGLDLRYNFGLTNINKEDEMGDGKNGVFSIALSYSF